jgi:hypothetical protein
VFEKGRTIVPEGLVTSMAEALAVAESEVEPASSTDTDTGLPPAEVQESSNGEQAPEPTGEHPAADESGFSDEAQALAESLIDTTDGQNESDSGVTPGSDDFWSLQVDVDTVTGPEKVTVRELTDGYLRQADYTQKTQALSEQRKYLEKADSFYGNFQSDPHEFARALSVQAGLIEEGAIPVKEIEGVKIPTQEDLDAQVSELVEERVASNEDVQAAKQVNARIEINAEFDRLQTVFSIPISPDLRESLIDEARRTGQGDLEGILAKRLVLAQGKSSQAAAIGQAATNRPGSPPAGATLSTEEQGSERPTIREAFKQAQVEAAQQ